MSNAICDYRRERFNSAQPLQESITDDTFDHGAKFISDWFVQFTNSTLEISLPKFIIALIEGILIEGKNNDLLSEAQHLVNIIQSIEKKTIETLQMCCARLYTKPSFLFKIVNGTLRDNDRTKLMTLGPFCYLLYDYIGVQNRSKSSVRKQLKKVFKSKQEHSKMTVYRGEHLLPAQIEKYKQVIGTNASYKWQSFISTSKSRKVAEIYGANVIYVIQIPRISSRDQCADLSTIAYIPDEQEILLQSGVRLTISHYEENPDTGLCVFHVQILPSFLSHII